MHARPDRRAAVAATLAVLLSACGLGGGDEVAVDQVATAGPAVVEPSPQQEPSPEQEPTPTATPVEPLELEPYVGWTVPTLTSVDDRDLVSDEFTTERGGDRVAVSCTPTSLPTLSRSFDHFPAFAMTSDPLPGLVVEGRGLLDGDLRALPLERAAVTLVSSLAQDDPVRVVDTPTTSSLSSSVSDLKRSADARLTGIDVVPSDITFTERETHSFEETALSLDVSLRYRGRMQSAGLDTSYDQERGVKRHTISVRFLQPMYTIAVERDQLLRPRDVFAPSVGEDDLDVLLADGRVAAENPPLLVDQVTYGRVMYFTMSSTEVSSAQDLAVAVEGARAGVSGEAELTTEQRETLSSSRIDMVSYGGDQDLALTAIRTGDLSAFFGPANTTTAAPLSFTARTLDGQVVEVADTADLQQLACDEQVANYTFTVELSGVEGRARVFVNGAEVLDVRDTPENILEPGRQARPGSGSATIDRHLNFGANGTDNEVEVRFESTCVEAQFTFRVRADGQQRIVDSLDKCAFVVRREYQLDTTTGDVTPL